MHFCVDVDIDTWECTARLTARHGPEAVSMSLFPRASGPPHVYRLSYPPPHLFFNFSAPFHTMNDCSSTRLQLLFDAALQSYENQTRFKLIDHPLARQLENCHTVDSVMDVLQHQACANIGSREDDGKIMRSLKQVVHVLHALSTSTTLGEGIGLVRLM